nr:hypothetical protein [Tanacetum cinerariifolium]
MKFNGVILILVVLFAFALISSEGRNLLQATTQTQSPKPAEASSKGQKHRDWGGCWSCWKKRRLQAIWLGDR